MILIFIYLPNKTSTAYLLSVLILCFAHRKVKIDMQIYVCTLLIIYHVVVLSGYIGLSLVLFIVVIVEIYTTRQC